MKSFFILYILLQLLSFSALSQKLKFSEKRTWRHELKEMNKRDQHYRIMFVNNPGLKSDSTWRLQTSFDSINKIKFKELIEKYGFPTFKRVRNGNTIGLILHFTLEQDLNTFYTVFERELKKGNMPPFQFAIWYDRCCVNMKKPTKYGAYGKKIFCGDDLEIVNKNRVNIGLEILPKDKSCF